MRRRGFTMQKRRMMRWTLGATAQRRHLLDMMSTSLSPTSLHGTVLEPLRPAHFLAYFRRRSDEGGLFTERSQQAVDADSLSATVRGGVCDEEECEMDTVL